MRIAPLPQAFDLVVAGAGHAGCEAALATARMGLVTLLVTSNIDHIGHTSCNPAIGGPAKSHMVFEIDALGGSMGYWADKAAVQVRRLNQTKGPAVQATRAQVDRLAYRLAVQQSIFEQTNLYVAQGMVEEVLTAGGAVSGVRTRQGQVFLANSVLLTAGTFMGGRIHVGGISYAGGRFGDEGECGLTASLQRLGLTTDRFMTCTPPRVLAASVDFSQMQTQYGDTPTPRFSVRGDGPLLPQTACHLTWTTEETHGIIRKNVKHSAIYNGNMTALGPRYCPSIEDKIVRYPDKQRHQVFVEPEGHSSPEIYPSCIFTGLPYEVQVDLLHSIPGFEHCHITQPGYAIEYDLVSPVQLSSTLETKTVPGLWCAGQINGTSGYEEAAAQGLWAALNIAAKAQGRTPFLPGRETSYIAVLVDDLVTKGTNEPYRMFTSRAEYRLLLRESNAESRLTPLGREHGLVSDGQWASFTARQEQLERLMHGLQSRILNPNAVLLDFCASIGETPPLNAIPLGDLVKRPSVALADLAPLWEELLSFAPSVLVEAETAIRYSGYVARQRELAERTAKAGNTLIPEDLDYQAVAGLTREAREKLMQIRPATIGQAGRIQGMTPAALTAIEIHMVKMARGRT